MAVRRCLVLVLATAAALSFTPVALEAQRPNPPAPAGQRGQPVTHAEQASTETADSAETRRDFEGLLRRYPPDLGRVLKLDPSLLDHQEYLAPYPGLWDFLQQHPEVKHNPGFFLQSVGGPTGSVSQEEVRNEARARMWSNILGGFTAFSVFLVVTASVLWLVKVVIDQRRWNRLSRIQADAHNKLLDRFSANEDLVAYIQTPAGRRFLESAPIPLHEEPRSIGAPFSRILWSLQAGVVLAVGGLGLLIASGQLSDEPSQFFLVLGVLAIALGAGFVISAGAAYVLSRRLGLFDKATVDHE